MKTQSQGMASSHPPTPPGGWQWPRFLYRKMAEFVGGPSGGILTTLRSLTNSAIFGKKGNGSETLSSGARGDGRTPSPRFFIFACGLVVASLGGVAVVPGAGAQDEVEARQITEQLKNPNPVNVTQAAEQIRLALEDDPEWAVAHLRKEWLKVLVEHADTPFYAELVEDLTLCGILADPSRTADIEAFLQLRIKMRRQEGQVPGAIADAKSLFNVAGMRSTNTALRMLAECLDAEHGAKAPELLARLRKEQFAGAEEKTMGVRPQDGVMKGLAVESGQYLAAVSRFPGEDRQSRLARGNLLLLADHGAEARTLFEKVLVDGDAADKVKWTEDVARAIKAEDGAIGRANAYLRQAWNAQVKPE